MVLHVKLTPLLPNVINVCVPRKASGVVGFLTHNFNGLRDEVRPGKSRTFDIKLLAQLTQHKVLLGH